MVMTNYKPREVRSNKDFFDSNYWEKYWKDRFNVTPSLDNKVANRESNKKLNYLKRYVFPVENALDVGCGYGFLVNKLREEKVDAYGIDVSTAAVARSPVKKFLKVMDVKSNDSNKFELVTCFDLLEHLFIEEIFKAVKQINRVASKYILIRLPVLAWNDDRDVNDFSYKSLDKSHVSIYPQEFWVRRFCELKKFDWCFSHLWNSKGGGNDGCEAWITFKRISDGTKK